MSADRHLVIDAGHGGSDSGAVNAATGAKEKDVVLSVAIWSYRYASEAGLSASLTRDNDSFISLGGRVKIANDRDADLLSIHCNAFNRTANGFEAFTSRGTTQSDSMAEAMLNEYDKQFNLKARFDLSDGDRDKEASFTVLGNRHRAVLFELGFIDSPIDEKFLTNTQNQKLMAQALINGILIDRGLPKRNFVQPLSENAIIEENDPVESTGDVVSCSLNIEEIRTRIKHTEYQLAKIKSLLSTP